MNKDTSVQDKKKQKIDAIEISDEHLTSRAGLALFAQYLQSIQLMPIMEKMFASMRKKKQDAGSYREKDPPRIPSGCSDPGTHGRCFFDQKLFESSERLNIGYLCGGKFYANVKHAAFERLQLDRLFSTCRQSLVPI